MSKLCLVPTPIGNLEDITLRSIRILNEADFILAEDTRVTKKLLAHLEISKQVYPFHAHNEHNALNNVIQKITSSALVVLVSDAGTPGISDPGFLLVRECIKNNISVECLPGATAFVPALVASGFPCDKFVFEGFLPHKKGRQTRLQLLAEEPRTIVLYESPHRLIKLLGQIEEFFGKDRNVCVVRELTKIYEEFKRGVVTEVKQHYENHEPKGEIVVIVEGKSKE
ncbi:MAG: 16S rRNA (cytidine(1402)-2'-O)-methyltransferase [Crocinitomicaceae bacterium]|nr:16S rRNA (cytidine(1402)-2'-O)-methyltransferase [Crocinitomicaceae bacterium]